VVVPRAGTRAFVRPIGVAGIGLLTVIFAAWGGICVFVGPLFGYTPTSTQAWQWTMQNWLLHLVPGAVGVFAGLMMLGLVSARGARRSGVELAALLSMAAGIWFVIGPAVWPMFESSSPYAQATSANMDFLNQLGANLGPGLLLAILGGMAFKAGIAKPRVMLDEEPMEAAPVAAAGTAGYVPGDDAMTTAEPAMRRDAVAGDEPRAVEDEPGMMRRDTVADDEGRVAEDEPGTMRREAAPVENAGNVDRTGTAESPGATGTMSRGPEDGTMSPPSSPV